jgi:hypothetical protein
MKEFLKIFIWVNAVLLLIVFLFGAGLQCGLDIVKSDSIQCDTLRCNVLIVEEGATINKLRQTFNKLDTLVVPESDGRLHFF